MHCIRSLQIGRIEHCSNDHEISKCHVLLITEADTLMFHDFWMGLLARKNTQIYASQILGYSLNGFPFCLMGRKISGKKRTSLWGCLADSPRLVCLMRRVLKIILTQVFEGALRTLQNSQNVFLIVAKNSLLYHKKTQKFHNFITLLC